MAHQMNIFDLQERARLQLEGRFKMGEEQEAALINTVAATVIQDRLVAPKAMRFTVLPDGVLHLSYRETEGRVSIHRHALNQLCAKVKFPMEYLGRLEDSDMWKAQLLEHNLNELFHNTEFKDKAGNPRFLHRLVGMQLRGFLSRRYNRYIASAPLLRTFVESCRAGGARPIEAVASPVINSLKCLLPNVFEAFPGEHVGIGVTWSNSDFGSGKCRVMQTIWRINTASSAVVDEGLSRAHLGSIIEDSDLEMSDETAQKEVAAQQSAIHDHVKQFLGAEAVERILSAIAAAKEDTISWEKLRSRLRDILSKGDLDWLKNTLDMRGESIIDLPPISFTKDNQPIANRYWVAQAVSVVAQKTEDPDRKFDLQRQAGNILAGAF
jgi:hypothetical protein